jgi:hypothetical protein
MQRAKQRCLALCTGKRFIDMLRQKMPDKVVYSNVGSRYSFGG